MIKSLCLKDFGRFSGKTFTFAPVTLFSGPNEAGKTTIFDAIFDVVSSPRGNSAYGKILTGRYGRDRKVVPEYQGEALSITDVDFINLFAIRSGEIDLNMEQPSQWMNQIKASLFSGGINPQEVIESLDVDLTSNARGTLGGEEKKLNEEVKKLKDEKKTAEALKQKCHDEEAQIAKAKSRNAEVSAEISLLEAEIKKIEISLNQQRLLRDEESLNTLLTNVKTLQRMEGEQDKYSRFDQAVLDELKKMEEETRNQEAEAKKSEALEEAAMRERSDSADAKAQREKEKQLRESEQNLASFLISTLAEKEKLVSRKTRRLWRKPPLVIAGIIIIAGIAAFMLMSYNWVVLAALLAAAGVCIALSQKSEIWEDTGPLNEAVQMAREKWKDKTGEDPGATYSEILGSLNRAAERARAAAESFTQADARLVKLDKDVLGYALQKKQRIEAAESTRRQMHNLLNKTETANIDDYVKRLENKKNIALQCTELRKKIETSIKENNANSIPQLEDILSLKKDEISRKITEPKLPDQEVRNMENRLEQKRKRFSELNSEHSKNAEETGQNLGTILGKLNGIPEKIVECEKEIQKKGERLSEISRERRAMEIASELFASIAGDSSLMLEQLSREISERFSTVIDSERTVNMGSFSVDSAEIKDATGSGRKEDFLSAGTRDAFFFAARLVLAEKSLNPDNRAIIVLDEPFLALDRQRTGRALAILEKFHKDTELQIVIFTKDEETEKQACAVFGKELCIHKL